MKKKRIVTLGTLGVALALVVAACGGASSSSKVSQDAVAKVDKQEIPKADLDALIQQAQASYKTQNRPFPRAGTADFRLLQDQAVKFLIQREEFAEKAKDLGITVTDRQVESRLRQIKQQYYGGQESQYRAQIARQGLTDQAVHEYVRAQIVSQDLFNKVTASVKVSDGEVADYYKTHPEQYSQPQTRDVRHILVADKATADKIYLQLKKGASFAALAKRYSLDPGSKDQGGKLTISKGQTVPPFDRIAFSLATNQLSKPVKTQFGWHVIQALSTVKPRQTTPLAQVGDQIRAQLLQQKRNQTMTKWVGDLDKEFKSRVAYQAGYAPPPPPPPVPTHHPSNGGNA